MKLNFIISLVLSLLGAVCCGIRLWLAYDLWALAFYAGIIIVFPVSIVLHELGHMLFGAMVKIKAVPHFSLFGASCCEIIPKTDKNLKGRIIFTASGGLAVNAILVIVGLIGINFYKLPAWLCIVFPANLYLLWINALGYGSVSAKSDGGLLRELISGSPASQVMLAVLAVQAQVLNGKPIGEIDERLLFSVPQIREDDPAFISLTELRYEYFKAKGDEEQAGIYKTRLEDLKEYLN